MANIHTSERDDTENDGPPCPPFLAQEGSSLNKCDSHIPDSFIEVDDSGSIPNAETRPDDDIDSSLCVHCQHALNKWAEDFTTTEHEDHQHWNGIVELENSAFNGCPVCGQFLQDRQKSDLDRDKERIQNLGPKRVYGTMTFYGKVDHSVGQEPYVVLRFMKSPLQEQKDSQEVEEDSDDVVCHYAVDIVRPDSSYPQSSSEAHPARNALYPLHLISQWLRDCRQNHQQCRSNGDQFVPSRLISTISPSHKLVLKDELRGIPEYATLSHCWGQERYDMLTSKSLKDFQMRGVPGSALSNTFKQAITVARDLGISYIWIDSLCIIQDDESDWLHEAATMSSVYGHSTLNIAASGAPSGKFGCFSTVTGAPLRKFRIAGSNKDAVTYGCLPDQYYRTSLGDMPLMKRGWTLQERLLPDRSVHFTTTQVFWECQERVACEMFPDQFPQSLAHNDVYLNKTPLSRAMWSWIVERYTHCNLTYGADKLVAVSGLARQIHSQSHDQYVVGMWRDGLERQLCWMVNGINGRRVSPYRAPTWSWASLDVPVWWSYHDHYVVAPKVTSWIEVLDVAIKFIGHDRFGGIRSARLRLSCSHLLNATFEHTQELDEFDSRITLMCIAQKKIQVSLWMDEDCYGDGIAAATVLPVCSSSNSSRLRGLLLQRTPEEGNEYTRLGVFGIDGTEIRETFDSVVADIRNSVDSSTIRNMREDELGKAQWIIDLV